MPSQCPLEKAEQTLLRIPLLRILLLLFLVITAPCSSFAARELDGFNINITGTATITGEVHAVAVQPWDGQIIIGGNFTLTEMVDVSESGELELPKVPGVVRSNLARLNNDGSVDTTFAPEPDGPVYAIVIEQDRTDPTKAGQSRIYIGGDYGQIAGVARGGLARLGAADGLPDSFAPAAAGTVVNAMLLQPNNRRVVVGGTFVMMDGTACSNLAAISIAAGSDGDLVQSFSGGTNDAVHALLLQEGYLVVGGSFTAPRKHLARFDPEDLLDGAFSAEPEGVVRALALQPDGMILVGGDFTTISTSLAPLQPRRYLARLTSEGELDSFDPLLEEFEAAGVNRVAAIAVQPDGKILAAGRFTKSTGNAAKPQQYHLARFQLNGAFDPGIDTKSNDAINAIVLEPNGRFLVGGKFTSVVTAQGVRARTGLARFYFHGGLDDDGAPFPPSVIGTIYTLALHPDGSVTFGGETTGGPGKTRIAKLDPDLNLVPGYGDGVLLNHWSRFQSLRADGKNLVGGWFVDPRVLLAQFTMDGTLDTFTTFLDAGPLLQGAFSWMQTAVLLPKVSRTSRPVGTMASEGMMYLALTRRPKGGTEAEDSHSLVRVTATGDLDPTFGPVYFDQSIQTVTLQDDGKILVGGEFSGNIVRLHSNGDKDTDFQPWRPFGGTTRVDGITVLKDGSIVVNGLFTQIISPDSKTTEPFTAIYKLRSDGSLDDTFHSLITYTYWEGWVQGVTVLNDQTMILHGLFDQVNGLVRTCIVRVSQKGEVVGPNPLLFWTDYMNGMSVVGIGVQPDGKILAGGSFDVHIDGSPPMNRLDAKYLTRMSNIFRGTEEVVVAPGGSSITWLRGGTGPELRQVWFEEKSDAPGAEWEYLGAGVPVDGGWKISLPAPEAAPQNGQLTLKQNRYVRARGYGNSVGANSGYSTLVESVRQYYLKEPIKVRAEAQTKVYGEENPASYTAAYFDAGGEPILPAAGTFFGTPTFSTPRTPTSPVGNYAVTADVSGMSSPVYSFVPEEGTLTVTRRSASVEPDDIDRVYGQAVEYGGTLNGFLPGDNVTATYSHAGGNTVAGSPHTISATLQPVGVLGNYDIAYGTGDLRFSPKDASVRPAGLTKNYGDPVVLTGTLEGFLPGDNVTASYSREAGDTVAGSPYSISATLEPVSVLGNYNITYHPADLTFTKKDASVTPAPLTKVYGEPVELTGTLQGFLASDNVTATYSRVAGNTVAGSPYSISATLSPVEVLDNYNITYNTGHLTFTKKDASVTPAPLTKVYGEPIELSGTLDGFLPGDNVTATYSREPGNSVAGSPYGISATLDPVAALDNYNITYNTADCTITKKAASITPDPATKEYGSTAAEIFTGTLSGFLAADNVSAAYSRAAGNTVAGGPYTISATLSPAELLGNYDITYNTADFTITKKTASVTPHPASKEYGSTAAELLTGTLSGFLAADNVSAAYSRAAGNTVAGGPYTISATLGPAELLGNYDITYNTADFTITKKAASVTPDAASREYGSTAAELLTGTLSGFLAADNVSAAYSRAAGNTVAGGPYTISATLSPAELLGNYDITYNTADFTITKKTASVTPDPASKEYGSTAAELLTGTLSGFLAADGVTASYSRVPGETVAGSPYAITATLAPAAVLENYDITYGTAGFSIAKKAASVTPVAASKEYGSADPAPFTGNLSGFLPSDGVTASYSRIPGETSAGSPYVISAILSPAEVLSNYDITYNTAGFVIGKKPATVTAVSATKVYGEADPALLAEGSGFLPADLGPAMVTLRSSRPPGENAGGYVLTPVVDDGGTGLLGNYHVTLVPGSLTILKAPLTITAQDKSRTFGAPDPEFTAAYSGLVGSDTPDSLGGIPAFTTTADAASPSGSYPIVPALGTITSTNYEFSFVNGILTVMGGAPQSIVFNPLRPKTYGDGDFDPGARASSGLPVSYASSAPAIAAVVGDKIRVLAPGSAEITASQGGNAMFAAAEDVTRGLVVNPPPWNGVGFDGSDDFIEVADAPQLDFGSKNGFSIETWLYLDGSQPDGTGLLSKGEGGDPWSGYQLILRQNRIAAEIAEGTVTVGPADGLAGSSNIADGRWHHVAVAVDRVAATATLYLDGRVEAEVAHAALRGNPDNAAALVVGRDRSGSRFFRGRIDELRLWDSARSREEIRASVSQIIDPLDEPHLVAYFHLDEGDAGLDNAPFATAPERTSYAANGTLRNFALTGTGSNWISSGAFLPLLETSAAGSITSDGATAGGNVYPNYYPATETGLCWGTSPDPGEGDSCSSYGSAAGPFTGTVTGLDPGTTYHLRGYAKNQIGTAYGNDVTFQTAKLDQIITFGALEERVYGDAPFLLNGSSSGGLALSYTSSAADVAEVAGDQVRIKGAGSATITAWQTGNATYNAALPVAQSFVVQKRPVTVTADNKSRAYQAENPLLTASYQGFLPGEEGAVTGLPLLATTATPASPVGSYQITAGPGTLSAANYRFLFAGGVLTVRPAAQQITFNPMRPKTFGDRDFDPGATASSALPVAYASAAPGVAAVAGNRLKVVAPGTAAITASQSGSELFDAAQDVTRELVVNPPPWNGLKFDGSDDLVRVADGAPLAFGSKTGFTLESWLYLDGAQPEGSGVLSKGGGGSAWSGFNLFLQQDRIAAEIGYGAESVGIADGLIGSSTLNDGQWHHVALSVDRVAATASLYLDGRLEARLRNPLLGGSPDNLNPLHIGVDRSGSRFFKGRIDELRLWGSARSREEIRGSVSQIIDPQEQPDLAAYFHLDEGDAGVGNAAFATAPERTAHAADGALLNFALDGADSNWVRSGAFLPLLETAPVTLITSSAATGGGTIYPNYYPATDYGLCWSSAPNPSLSDSCSHSGSGTGPFVGLIAGLTPGATYHARGFATNLMGTAYGNDVTFQAARLDQSITFGPLAERTYGDPGFPLVASASSSLPVTYASSDTSVAVVENGMIIPRGAGRAIITASQGGDQSFNAAAAVSQPFVVNKKQLTVSADATSRAYRTPNPAFTVSFQGFVTGENSGVVSGAAQLSTVASLDSSVGSYPIVVGVGSLSADNYRFLAVDGTLTVFRSCQEIVFPSLGDRTYGDPPVEITASSCSGLGLSFASSNPLVATVSGNILTITGAGSSTITASQRGNGDLEQAPDVSQTLVVHKRGQVITFPPLPPQLLGDDPLLLAATASSGLPVSYASSDPAVAAVSGSTLTIAGTGTAVITARQEGSGNFHPALPASQPFTVALEGTLPALRLSALSSGSATASPVINVTGSAQDDSGITSLTVNDADLTGSAALFSSAVPLSIGENSITVSARDGAGNVASETLSVTLDATAPAIAVAEPADNSVTDQSLFTAKGTVPAGSTVTMAVNGAAPQPLAVTSGTFTGTGYLQAGLNTVELKALLSGRSALAKRSVTLAAGAPPVAITDPGEDLRTEADSTVIRGRVGTRAGGTVRLEVNGAAHTPAVEGGVFQQQIAMDRAGEYRVTVTAGDSEGNSSGTQRNIIKVDRIAGDLDRDGVVDIGDAIALLRISLGIDPVTGHAVLHGDVAPIINGVPQPDGKIGVGDVLVLLRKIVGLIE